MVQNISRKSFVSWSGGKDSALACCRAMSNCEVNCLLNMVAEDGQISRSHGIRTSVLRMQGEVMDLPVVQPRSSWETYEAEFKKAVNNLKDKGITVGIFGDIDLIEHRQWVERVCENIGIEPVLPLWGEERETLLEEFIEAGFEAVVVATRKDVMGPEWLGRIVDQQFVMDISKLKGVDISGENGEYHTFVVSGPIFRKKINILESEKIIRDQHCFLDILKYELAEKVELTGSMLESLYS